jgi:hypothetical protein
MNFNMSKSFPLWLFVATTNAAIFGNRLLFNMHFVVFHKKQGHLLEERFYRL